MTGQPVGREEAAVDDLVAGGRLHPAVGREDPEGRQQRAERHHQRRDEMRPGRHQLAAEQQHAEEGRFEEEGGQPFIGEERRQHIGRRVGEAAPVGAELERHDDAGHDAHAEGDREYLDPECRDPEIDLPAGEEMQPFQHGDEGRQPDREAPASGYEKPTSQANCNRDRNTGSSSMVLPAPPRRNPSTSFRSWQRDRLSDAAQPLEAWQAAAPVGIWLLSRA